MDTRNPSLPSVQVTAPPRPAHATDRYDGPTIVYRMFDAADRLLYVGVTCNKTNRWKAHRRTSAWWKLVARKELATYPDRNTALTAELAAIRTEKPIYNVSHHPRATPRTLVLALDETQALKIRALAQQMGCTLSQAIFHLIDATPDPLVTDSDPDMDEALRRARTTGGGAR